MINTKKDLKLYLLRDNQVANYYSNRKRYLYMKKVRDAEYYIGRYLRYLRLFEFYLNQKSSLLSKCMMRIFERKKNQLGLQLGFSIHPNCFDEGLTIYHHGCIIVNSEAKIGKNCKLHGNNCIGNNGVSPGCPKIGDNVDIGFGAVIIGDVVIADNIIIGANAVVNKSFLDSGATIAGVPAKKVK